ncbi:MAG: DUF664 domain-containing protein [Streptosporangiaceae bacterium]
MTSDPTVAPGDGRVPASADEAGSTASASRTDDVPVSWDERTYKASCARYRELVASLDLDTPSKGPMSWRTEPVTLRWILFHLIEETARHNGHIDILREMADGVTGR